MSSEPWDVPLKKSSRRILTKLIKKYEKEGQMRELGITCSRMAQLLKEIGPMSDAAIYGQKAIEYLRRTDDKKELAKALRVACIPFSSGPHKEWLEESLALSRQIGDKEEEGWTIYRFTRAFTPTIERLKELEDLDEITKAMRYREMADQARNGHTVEEALGIFEEIGNDIGIATCLLSLGVESRSRAQFDRAVELYERAGDSNMAGKARMFAETFAPLPKPWDLPDEALSIPVLLDLVSTYRTEDKIEELGLCLSRLSEFMMKFGTNDGTEKGKVAFTYASEAVQLIERLHRGTDYCQALLNAGSSMVSPQCKSLLKRCAKRAEEIFEMPILAWATYHLGVNYNEPGYTVEGALEIFQELGDSTGITACQAWIETNRIK